VLNVRWHQSKVIQQKFEGKYTKASIKSFVQNMSNEMKSLGKNGWTIVSLKYPIGWRSGYKSNFGDPTRLYHHDDSNEIGEEPDYFEEFAVYYVKKGKSRGGCSDIKNDCLYHCLKMVLHDDLPWDNPWKLKKYLHLSRDDQVDITSD
jgi:hypothetical protein